MSRSDWLYMLRDPRFWLMLTEGLLFWGVPLFGLVYGAVLLWKAARKKWAG